MNYTSVLSVHHLNFATINESQSRWWSPAFSMDSYNLGNIPSGASA